MHNTAIAGVVASVIFTGCAVACLPAAEPPVSPEENIIVSSTAPVPGSAVTGKPGAEPANGKAVGERRGPEKEILVRVWLWQESRDCLWNLAKKYYGDPWQWKTIYLANRYQIDDPRVIYPRQVLVIPPLDSAAGSAEDNLPSELKAMFGEPVEMSGRNGPQ